MKKSLFVLLILFLLPSLAKPETVEINGIFYNLIKKANAAEIARNPEKYSGDIVIPETIEYDGVDYNVDRIAVDAFNESPQLQSVTISNRIECLSLVQITSEYIKCGAHT